MTAKTAKKKSEGASLESILGPSKIPLVTTSGNHMVFSAPKATTKPLPTITGPVTVSFKHEDTVGGMAVGPVVVTDCEPYDVWLKIHGVAHTNGRGETSFLVPFGSAPEGRHDLGWATKHVACEIAAHYGVALKEF